MPRNSQGVYTLPAGNPVVPGTLIETTWANPTMADIADALTASLPRDGSAPMTGPLTLQAAAPTQPRHAVSKGYMEQFLAYATGMPIGAITPIAGSTIPAGYLLCDGQAVSRTTYADLFTAIGTIYGSGDGATTFNVPDLRDWFIRGRGDARAIGSTQAAAFASHAHSFSDPGHTHTAFQTAHDHTITTGGHNHGVNDPGHFHQATFYTHNDNGPLLGNANGGAAGTMTTDTRATGISLTAAGNLGGSADSRQPAVTVAASVTGASIGAAGGDETRPQNVAMNYVIKAVNDSASVVSITGITSSDDNMIAIDNTNPVVPMLDIKSNVAFGTVKLNSNNKVPQNLLEISTFQYLGPWDASSGQTPSQALPSEVFSNGDLYQISIAGTLLLFNSVGVASATPVVSTDQIAFIMGSPVGLPNGWYFQPSTTISGVTAGAVTFTPVGTIAATNVQAAIAEVSSESAPITHVGTGGEQHANVVAAGASGFMTGADKTKLDSIASGAQVNTVNSVNSQTGAVVLTAADVGALTQAGADSLYVNVSGDTMSGNLTTPAVLVSSAQNAAVNALTRKDYVDGLTAPSYLQANSGSTTVGTAFTAFPSWTKTVEVNGGTLAAGGGWNPPIKGIYQINYTVNFASVGVSAASIQAQMRKNGTVFDSVGTGASSTIFPVLNGSIALSLLITDTVDVGALINVGTAGGVSAKFTAALISPLP